MNSLRRIPPLLLSFWMAGAGLAADKTNPPAVPATDAARAGTAALIAGLKPRRGEIDLRSGMAKVRVPEGYSFLDADDTTTVLVKLWGNPPPKDAPLGMLFPSSAGVATSNLWAVVLHYDAVGHVADTGADAIDFAKVLVDLKRAAGEASKDRVRDGFPSIEVTRWASPPRYDGISHKFHWAKELRFGGSDRVLNYNIRVLGRRGMLVMNAVAPMSRFSEIEAAMPKILGLVDFEPGHRYADFEAGKDKVAPYGLAALVAGDTADKSGRPRWSAGKLWAAKGLLAFVVVGGAAFLAVRRPVRGP